MVIEPHGYVTADAAAVEEKINSHCLLLGPRKVINVTVTTRPTVGFHLIAYFHA